MHSEILDRVKKKLGIFSGGTPARNGTDFLIKMNLPPLMGRRDAAADRVGEAMYSDIFEWENGRRREVYRRVIELIDLAIADTRLILAMLSSPDTASRERRQLEFWQLMRDVAAGLDPLAKTDLRLGEEEMAEGLFDRRTPAQMRSPAILNDCEIALVNRFRELFDLCRPQLTRYREYAAKSFSKPNAARYSKAYEEYFRYYDGSRTTDEL